MPIEHGFNGSLEVRIWDIGIAYDARTLLQSLIMGGLKFSVCGFASFGQEWVKNQHGVGSDWGFTKSNTV